MLIFDVILMSTGLNWGCWLTPVDLYNGHRMVDVVVLTLRGCL